MNKLKDLNKIDIMDIQPISKKHKTKEFFGNFKSFANSGTRNRNIRFDSHRRSKCSML